jgi:flavodoxin
MKTLVVYDSVYGNTEKIARAIGGGIGDDAEVLHAGDVSPLELEGIDLIIVGAPTQGGRPAPAMKQFLDKATKDAVSGKSFAAFDTRISPKWVGIFGYAAGRIGKNLMKKGGNLVVDPEGFYVEGTEGPLKDGEEARAAAWGKEAAAKLQ